MKKVKFTATQDELLVLIGALDDAMQVVSFRSSESLKMLLRLMGQKIILKLKQKALERKQKRMISFDAEDALIVSVLLKTVAQVVPYTIYQKNVLWVIHETIHKQMANIEHAVKNNCDA